MTELYTAVLIVECFALAVLGVLVWHNHQLTKIEKIRFCMTYTVLSLTAIFEWLAIFLNGTDGSFKALHIAAKCLDYIFTPSVAIFFVRQVAQIKKVEPFFLILLSLNAILQIVSCFTGWTFFVDAANIYRHGPIHWVYIIVYVAAFVYVALGFIVYAKRFPRQNLLPFLLLVSLAFLGVACQEALGDFFGGNIRVGTLSLIFASILLYIHYVSFSQQQKDLDLAGKEQMLRVDVLSQCLSRYAYNQAYDALKPNPLPEDFAVMYVDLNGLKSINDKYGHESGDEYIRFAGSVLLSVLLGKGECFRTGGDEFTVFLHAKKEEIENLIAVCLQKAEKWKGPKDEKMSFAIGYATVADEQETNLEELIVLADARMYQEKERYYKIHGIRRR